MSMSYSSLTASKGAAGAIATWASYTLLDTEAVLDEAQALLWGEGRMRVREMLADAVFTMPVNGSYVPLSSLVGTGYYFLDPIGDIAVSSFNSKITHKDSNYVQRNRNYNEQTGTLGTNPFTTAANSNTVSVYLENHGFTQDSSFYTTGATPVNGATIAGTFPVNGITDANDFTIDITLLGQTPGASGSGGGSDVEFTCDILTPGTPYCFGIYNERLNFEQAFFQQSLCRLQFYASPPLLSSSNPTNFLTVRYPNLVRVACLASAADFMKDGTEYQKQFTRLTAMIEKISNENDMAYRGMDLAPEIP